MPCDHDHDPDYEQTECTTSTDTTEAQDVECELCGQSPDDCSCSNCPGCSERVEHTCSNCEACEDCCECCTCSRVRCSAIVDRDDWCSDCERCRNCCECYHCDDCGRNITDEYQCSECNSCERCCSCTRCSNCCEVSDNLCSDCGQCESCGHNHGCEADDNSSLFQKHSLRFVDAATFDRNPSRRHISVELEVADADDRRMIGAQCEANRTSVVEDGSLPSTGFELNTQPTNGDAFVDLIRDTCKALKSGGAEATKVCGYHVHVDARDFTFHDITRLIKLYARVEPALFKCVSPSRRSSHFCMPCGEEYLARVKRNEGDAEEGVCQAVYHDSKQEAQHRKRSKYDSARYAAMNLHSWMHRGTVECRMHQGTINPSKVINWALLWAALIDAAKTREIEPLPVDGDYLPLDVDPLPIDAWDCLMTIAPSDDVRAWLRERRAELSRDDD